jgi:hypothetical protein
VTETVSSLEATDREKALIADLSPWPLSNEEAWAIAKKHLRDLELGYRIYRREAHEYEVKLQKIQMAVMNEPLSDPEGFINEILDILKEEPRNPEEVVVHEEHPEGDDCCPEEEA